MQERLEWIDAVKGFCLLLVIIAHLWQPCPYWVYVLTGGYMQVFFVMAGVTGRKITHTFREQMSSKSKRLLLPYAIYGLGLLVLGAFLPTHAEFGKGLLGLLYGRYSVYPPTMDNHIPLLQACGYLSPFWFLPCIFLSYLLLAWYDHSRYPYLIVLFAVLVGIVTPIIPVLLPWCIEMSFIGFLLMICGRMLRPLLFTLPAKIDRTFWLQLLVWFGSAIGYMVIWQIDNPVNMSLSQMGNTSIVFPFRFILFCLLGICEALFLSLCFRAMRTSFLTRGFAYVGRQTLRLMCIHLFIGQGVFYLLANRELPMFVTFTCALVTIFLVNLLLDSIISRKKSACNVPPKEH